MTIKDAKLEVSKLGMVLTKTEHGEFRVNFKGGSEATAYYANDLEDAIGTARSMSKEKRQSNRQASGFAADPLHKSWKNAGYYEGIRDEEGAYYFYMSVIGGKPNNVSNASRFGFGPDMVKMLVSRANVLKKNPEDPPRLKKSPAGPSKEDVHEFYQKHEHGIESSRMQSSKAVDQVSTQLERLRTEIPREAGRLRDVILRLDRVANTLEVEESVSERVSQIENELEGLGVDFTVEPNSSHKEATCIFAYRGQLDPREEPSILGRVAKKYGSFFENTSKDQPYKIMIPHS